MFNLCYKFNCRRRNLPWFTRVIPNYTKTKKTANTQTHPKKNENVSLPVPFSSIMGGATCHCLHVYVENTHEKKTPNTHIQTHPKKSGNIVLQVSLSSIVGGATCHGLHLCSVWYASRACTRNLCCSVLQCVAVCCDELQCVAVCCSVLQCVAVWSSV